MIEGDPRVALDLYKVTRCAGLRRDEISKAKRRQVVLSAKENSERMALEFSHPTRSQMPEIACPDPFGMETFHQLAKDRINTVTHMGQKAWPGLFLVGCEFEGSQEQ
jgi:hypothetical protein